MVLNPIIRREAQTSLRSYKIFLLITVYVAFMAIISSFFIKVAVNSSYSGFDPKNILYLYALLSGIQFGYVLITVPSLTAGSISGEREKQTLDLLLITKMSPFSIVFGKLLSGIGVIILMIIASMPVYAILFYFGGVPVTSIVGMNLFMVCTAFMVGSVSIFFSTIFKRTVISIVAVYIVLSAVIFGTYIAYMLYVNVYIQGIKQLYDVDYTAYFYAFLSINPGAGFFSVIDAQLGTSFLEDMTMLSWAGGAISVPVWLVNSISNIAVGVIFLKLAAHKINPARK